MGRRALGCGWHRKWYERGANLAVVGNEEVDIMAMIFHFMRFLRPCVEITRENSATNGPNPEFTYGFRFNSGLQLYWRKTACKCVAERAVRIKMHFSRSQERSAASGCIRSLQSTSHCIRLLPSQISLATCQAWSRNPEQRFCLDTWFGFPVESEDAQSSERCVALQAFSTSTTCSIVWTRPTFKGSRWCDKQAPGAADLQQPTTIRGEVRQSSGAPREFLLEG